MLLIFENNVAEAEKLLNGKLELIYKQEQLAIEQAIIILRKHNKEIETEVGELYLYGRRSTITSWISTIILTSLLAFLIGRFIINRINNALKQMSSVSAEITFRMNQQRQSISQQSNSANQTSAAMNELNTSFQHTQLLAHESRNQAKNAQTISKEGNNQIKLLLTEMFGHKEKVLAILDQILHLSEVINRIHSVVSTINHLTNQTNILALNAAVQAAHVKQGGEGFSVIAGEIRKLADESKKFVAHIDQLAENIKDATGLTIRISEEGGRTVQECIKLAQSSSQAFDNITTNTTNCFEVAEKVSLNIEQQSLAVHKVLGDMETLNITAHQNMIDMNQVNVELDKLNRLSNELKAII